MDRILELKGLRYMRFSQQESQSAMLACDTTNDEGVQLCSTENYLINEQIDIPVPAPGQVLVRVQACCLNPEDLGTRDSFDGRPWPRIPGEEVVGIVSDRNTRQFAFHKFRPGDRVFGQPAATNDRSKSYISGALQQYCLLDADSCCLVPLILKDSDAVTIPRDCFRAFCLMFASKMGGRDFEFPPQFSERSVFINKTPKTRQRIQKQHRELYQQHAIVVLGTSSPVGKFVLQIARMMEFGRIIAVGQSKAGPLQYGATHIIDEGIHPSVIRARVGRLANGRIIRAVDCVGQHLDLAVSLVSPLSLVHQLGSRVGLLVTNHPVKSKPAEVSRSLYRIFTPDNRHPSESEVGKEFWAKLHKWIMRGYIKPLPSEDIAGNLNPLMVNFKLDRYSEGVEWKKYVVYPNKSGLYLGNTGLGSCKKRHMKLANTVLKRRLSKVEEELSDTT